MQTSTHSYTELKPRHAEYFVLLVVLLVVLVAGIYAAQQMEHHGHHITGMNNHVVWGLPHVFAICLILAASGALNGASLTSVFGMAIYKPTARLSVLLALSLLAGGLMVLVLDLGRPDRLIVAMTTYNFRSIFSWNIFLYTGFAAVGIVYLWVLMERRFNHRIKQVGVLAFVWRLVLTTGTGSIFGFLVGRNALDSALMAPLFIALSLVLGTASLALVLQTTARWQGQALPDSLRLSLGKLLFWFVLAVFYFTVVHHLTNLYLVEHHATEHSALRGPMSTLFWFGHVFLGVLCPAAILYRGYKAMSATRLALACALAIAGAAALLYVIIIGSQSTPQRLFPDKTVLSSRFGDAGFSGYQASLWEWGLGAGGLALALLLCLVVSRILPLAPRRFSG